jgi:hypothetical protein
MRQHANTLWKQRREAEGTCVEAYLRETRGLASPPLDMLGYLPANPPQQPYPAMIVPFGLPVEYEPGRLTINDNEVQGVHLTFLDGIVKAKVDRPRKMIGTCKGMPIVLAPPNDGLALAIGEGNETALTAHQVFGVGAWAAGSASFMPALADVVPNYIECVIVAGEGDPAGQRGACELEERLIDRGFEVWPLGARHGA